MNNRMNKKLLIFFPILAVILLCLYLFLQQPSEGEILIRDLEDTQNGNVDPAFSVKKQKETLCFILLDLSGITAVKTEDTEDKCVLRAMLENPHGQIALSVEKQAVQVSTIEEETGVSLRRNNPEKYQEIEEILQLPTMKNATHSAEFESVVFLNQTEIVGFFQHIPTGKLLVVSIHDVAVTNKEVVAKFWNLVASVVLL